MTIYKYLIKDFKLMMRRLLGVILIVFIGVGFLIGLYTSVPNVKNTINETLNNHNKADLQVISNNVITNSLKNEIVSNSNLDIKNYRESLYMYHNFEIDNISRNIKVISTNFNNDINRLTLINGRLPNLNNRYYEIVVEVPSDSFSEISINTVLSFPLLDKDLLVVGQVSDPIYFAKSKQLSLVDFSVYDSIIYIDNNYINSDFNNNLVNNIDIILNINNRNLFSTNYRRMIDEIAEELKLIDSNLSVIKLYENENIMKLEADLNITEVVSNIFPVFFFIVVLLVATSSISKIISRRRYEFGTLQSLGFNNGLIVVKINFYVLLATTIGILLGIGLGIYLIPAIIHNTYRATYNLPTLIIKYHMSQITIISLLTFILLLAVTTIFLIYNLKDRPNDLLRGKSPKPGKKIMLERIKPLWKILPFKYKSSLRNIFRDKGQLLLTFIGVIGSVGLLLAGFGVRDSVVNAGSIQFDEIIKYNLKVEVDNNYNYEDLITGYNYSKVSINNAVINESNYIKVIIFDNTSDIINNYNIRSVKGENLELDNSGIYLSSPLARSLNLVSGDYINITTNGTTYNVVITAVFEMYFDNLLITTSNVINKTSNNHILFNNLEDNPVELVNIINSNEAFINIESDSDLMESFNQMRQSLNFVVLILVFFSTFLMLIINFTLTSINLNARIKEIGTLKVLGYSNFEVSGYMFRESAITSTITIILGLLGGVLLHGFLISQAVTASIVLSYKINIVSFIYTVLINLVVIGIVYVSYLPSLYKIEMVESLKSYE